MIEKITKYSFICLMLHFNKDINMIFIKFILKMILDGYLGYQELSEVTYK